MYLMPMLTEQKFDQQRVEQSARPLVEFSLHYERVADAIKYLQHHQAHQPSLEQLAQYIGLSPLHFQRIFSEWAGISPKRFLQFLTKEYAKTLLQNSRDVLSVSITTGLSSPGRLHDLMVVTEAMTPGEVARQGAGLNIGFGLAHTPLGLMLAGITERGVCYLKFLSEVASLAKPDLALESVLKQAWPQASFYRDDLAIEDLAAKLSQALIPGLGRPPSADSLTSEPLRLLLKGTNFQLKVWEALLRVPTACVISYGDLAQLSGYPKAARAVGSALARNHVAYFIPCHRVIRETGEFGQYRWGTERKMALLGLEQAVQAASRGSA